MNICKLDVICVYFIVGAVFDSIRVGSEQGGGYSADQNSPLSPLPRWPPPVSPTLLMESVHML